MSGYTPTPEQLDVIRDFGGLLFVSAAAGSGKTGVVMDGFVSALKQGKAEVDEILTITFTEKAAGEMIRRARSKLSDEGMPDERRQIERAHISTIHGFCSGLIRSNALALGIDPEFSVADKAQSEVLKEEAFVDSRELFIKEHGEEAIKLISAIDPSRQGNLFKVVDSLHDELRSRGQAEPDFRPPRLDPEMVAEGLGMAIRDALDAITESGSKALKPVESMNLLLEALKEDDRQKGLESILQVRPPETGKAKEAIKAVNDLRVQYISSFHCHILEKLRDLLVLYSEEYAARKSEAGLLDFEDLQLEALRLLEDEDHKGVRKRVSESFKIIVVDEFQDTNGLQCRIIGSIARGNVCFVGDENQSIYRFRHANVDLFREKRDEARASGAVRPLSRNFRSQKEILSFVDYIFSDSGMLDGKGYQPMEAGAKRDENGDPARVEVILVDGKGGNTRSDKAGTGITREAEAEIVAGRLKELYDSGLDYKPGGTAILVRKKKDAEKFKEALERRGVPAYQSIGRDYYQKLELGDAMSLLRLLVNPLDDAALLGVLRSPMVGVSDDTLVMLRIFAGKGASDADAPPLWPILRTEACLERLPNGGRQLLEAFIDEYEAMRLAARRQSLDKTVRGVIGFRNYAAIAAAGEGGEKAFANLLKLLDLAVDFETAWGRDLGAFVEFLVEQKERDVEEGEAPTEEEGSGSVQIMTIHSAKGLEFPVVVWGYMGDQFDHRKKIVMVGVNGEIGVDYKPLGEKGRHLFDYGRLNENEDTKGLEEEKRIGYVAMTRAERHLILCGSTDIDKSQTKAAASRKPIEWIKEALGLDSGNEDLAALLSRKAAGGRLKLDYVEDCPVEVSIYTDPEKVIGETRLEKGDKTGDEIPPLDSSINYVPGPAVYVPGYIPASALSIYRKCPRRYYLNRDLKLGAASGGVEAAPDAGGLAAHQMGTLVHYTLEKADLVSGSGIDASRERLQFLAEESLGAGIELGGSDCERAERLLVNFSRSPAAQRLSEAAAAGTLAREQDFSILLDDTTVIGGSIDALCRTEDVMLVVDYKTDRIEEEASLDDMAAHHSGQMAAYALAAARMDNGKPIEVVLAFLDRPGAEASRRYEAADVSGIEKELGELIESMGEGSFPPLDQVDIDFCPGCAGFKGDFPLCATATRFKSK